MCFFINEFFKYKIHLYPPPPTSSPLTCVKVAEGNPVLYLVFDLSVKGIYDNEPYLQKKQQRCQTGAQAWCVPGSHWRCSLRTSPPTDACVGTRRFERGATPSTSFSCHQR